MVFLGIDWGKIFSVPFWLNVNPGELSDLFEKTFILILVIFYGFYFFCKVFQKKLIAGREFIKAKFFQKIENFFLTMAICFTFIFFFRYEAIPYLGGRFWTLLWFIGAAVWIVYLVRYYFVVVKKQLCDLDKKKKYSKYFVKAKK